MSLQLNQNMETEMINKTEKVEQDKSATKSRPDHFTVDFISTTARVAVTIERKENFTGSGKPKPTSVSRLCKFSQQE